MPPRCSSISIVSDWLARVAPGVLVQVGFSENSGSEVTIFLVPVGIEPEPSLRNGKSPPLRARADFILFLDSGDAVADLGQLEELCFAAMRAEEFSVVAEGPSDWFWQSAERPPRPCLRLRVPLHRSMPEKVVPLVHSVLSTQTPFRTFRGRILAPSGKPLPGVEVRHEESRRRAVAQQDGSFVFPGLMEDLNPEKLGLSKGGANLEFLIVETGKSGETVLKIQLD